MIHQINSSNPVLFEASCIKFIPPKKQPDSSYLIGCVTNVGTPVYIQPPDGILSVLPANEAQSSEWVFTMTPETPDVFGNWMSDITAGVCDELYNKRSQWFSNSSLREEDIVRMFRSELDYSNIKDGLRQAQLRVNVAPNAMAFIDGVSRNIYSETRWSKASVILELVGVEYVNSKFQWKILVRQARISPEIIPEIIVPPVDFNQCIIQTASKSDVISVSTPPPPSEMKEMTEMTKSIESVELPPDVVDYCIDDKMVDADESVNIIPRNDVYYAQYKEAIRRANEAKELAIATYLEARQIKDTYLLDCETDSEDEWDSDNSESNKEYEEE